MLINVRSGQISTDQVAGLGFAVDIAEEVERASGVSLSVWNVLYGRPMGTVSWSAQVDSFADLATLTSKLAESSTYIEKVQAAAGLWIPGSFEDRLTNVVHTAGDPGPVGYVSSLTAVAAPGRMGDATTFGAEISDYVAALTGCSLTFCVDAFADMGQVTWFLGHADAAAVDTAQAAIAADTGYQERTNATADLFIAGTPTRTLAQRIS
jgi:hypothetical protein